MFRTADFSQWRGWALRAGVVLAVLVALGVAWQRWLAPTKIALVNYADFQAARIVKARPGFFVQVDALGVEQMARLGRYDLVLIFGRGLNLDEAQFAHLQSAIARGTKIHVDGSIHPGLDNTNLNTEQQEALAAYVRGHGSFNYAQLLRYARFEIDGKTWFVEAPEPPRIRPPDVLFWLDDEDIFTDFATFSAWKRQQPGWREGRPRLALLTSVPGPFNANREHVDATIEAFEAQGFDVVPMAAARQRLAFLQQVEPAAVVYMPHGRLTVGDAAAAEQWLAERNIPLFAPLTIFEEESTWRGDQRSFEGGMLSMSVTLPELDGAIAPMATVAQQRDGNGFKVFRALPAQLQRYAALVRKAVELNTMPNAEKKLAIYYYKGPGQSALTAGDLEVVPSLYAFLQDLKAQGWRVEELPDTEAEFAQLLQQRGPNIGPYARGDFAEFVKNADPATVSTGQLRQWCDAHPVLCEQVKEQFGPPPGQYLRTGDAVAVARVPLGNVVLLPQPLPGAGEDTFKLVHGTHKAPPWPYLASYLWTKAVFKPDAIMHFGTHGSLEFTPWKQVGLSELDWPDALIGDVPHVYLYTMSNVGEAMIAKRRSYAAIVSHLTPPFMEGGAQSAHKRLADHVQVWERASSPTLKSEHARDVQREAIAIGLHRDLNLPEDAPWIPEQLQRLAEHLETLEHTKITSGLYTLGTAYPRTELETSLGLMGRDALMQALAELDLARGKATSEQLDSARWLSQHYRAQADQMMAQIYAGRTPADVLASVVSTDELARAQNRTAAQDGDNEDERRFAEAVLILRERLAAMPNWRSHLTTSPARELMALGNALSGGFTLPSSGGDALINPAALPTGRNMYSIDAEKTPSAQAWRVGKQLVDQLLSEHRARNDGTWPHKIAITLWAGDFIHTEGVALAQIFYLLGVEPVRDPFGRVSALRLIEREALGRPRIDVVVQTSGQIRDLAASRLYLINRAVEMAAQARDADNAVAVSIAAAERALKERGLAPADARRYAGVRVFGGINGNYGTNIMGMVESGGRWQTDAEVAETYLHNMGAAFGEGDLWGAFEPGIFEAALAGTQAVLHPLQSNTWGPISLDHVYEFMGGLNLAVRHVTGEDPAAYFSDFRNPSRPSMREAGETIAVEARATLLNPAWIDAMAQGGASSAETFAETFRNVYGWNVMKPAAIQPELWDALHAVYVEDSGHTHEFFTRENPWALQEMTAVMLETARKGYWQPDAEILHSTARLHAELIARHGASGTGFVNDNPALRGFIAAQLDADTRPTYEDALQQANEGGVIDTERGLVLTRQDETPSQPADKTGQAEAAPQAARQDESSNVKLPGRFGVSKLVIFLVLGGLAAMIAWLRRRHARMQA